MDGGSARRASAAAGGEPLAGGAAVSDRDFARFQALIHREAGIWLAPVKKALLVGRLSRRLRDLGLASFGDYYERVVEDEVERVRMLDAICTNETHFFREPRHFDFLAERVFPRWREEADAGRRPRRARVWSAACSTGEEPYSLAMSLLAAFPAGWDLEVLASDLSTKVLARAGEAVWPIEKAKEIPEAYRKAYMLRGYGAQEGLMKAGPELREIVKLARVNLVGEPWPAGPFDLVFCRNVLIYFDQPTRQRLISGVEPLLSPGGLLCIGHTETLNGIHGGLKIVRPSVFRAPLAGPAA